MNSIVVLGANSFSGQDFVDLLLDDPQYRVIGVSRSPERSGLFLKYRLRKDLSIPVGPAVPASASAAGPTSRSIPVVPASASAAGTAGPTPTSRSIPVGPAVPASASAAGTAGPTSRYKYYAMDMNRDMGPLLAMLDDEKPSMIVNFAAQSEVAPSWEHPEHWFQTNTVALSFLVNHLRKQKYLKRYLHVSSPEAYGTCVGNVTEETPLNPSTPYAASKAAADYLLKTYAKQYGFPLLTVRATNVYGSRQQLFKIIPRSAIYIKLGRTIELHGGGRAVKSYIHIRDVSRGEKTILEKGRIGELYHLSPDHGVEVKQVVKTICERLGTPFEQATRTVDERPGQDAAYVIDSTKARTELGWKPTISLEEGLTDVVDWVNGNWAAIQAQPLEYRHAA